MRYLNTFLIALASALCATYLALWFTKPSPIENTTIPPLIFKEEQDGVVIWGGWKTVEGYQAPGTNAVEIRCNRTSSTCHEAVASIMHHDLGEDLEAQVFSYKISNWNSTKLEAVVEHAMGECLERRLVVHIPDKSAALSWLRIPRHSDTQPTLIRTPVPRSFGQAVGAQRRRGGIVSLRRPAASISSPACASIRP